MSMDPVKRVKPVAPYIGGKVKLADEIVKLINASEHERYCEPFIGMGGVFFRREFKPRSEIINDRNGNVANLFRILQRHYIQFMDTIKWQLTTRADFERLIDTDPATLTDLERAARFLYLQRTSFGGKVTGQSFGVEPGRSARFDTTKLGVLLEDVHTRLAGVVIENLDYKEFIKRYDDKICLFYLDPPYYGCEKDYGKDFFSRDEFEKMAELLAEIQGKFILSLNDTPEVRAIFAEFIIDAVGTTYSLASTGNKKVGEVIITNFSPNKMFF